MTGLGAFIPIMLHLSVFVAIGVLACWFAVGLPSVVRWWYVSRLGGVIVLKRVIGVVL